MITGDMKKTADSIATSLNIIDKSEVTTRSYEGK